MADEDEAFPTLDAADMALVTQLGVRRQVQEGEYLFREGDVTYDFFVLISAEVDILVAVDEGDRVIVHHGPGRFLGELNMLSGLRVFVSAKVVTAGEVVVVSRDHLRQLMATNPRLGDTILAAFVARRGLLMTGAAPTVRVIGSRFSPESMRIGEFLVQPACPTNGSMPTVTPRWKSCWRTSRSPPRSCRSSSPPAPFCGRPPRVPWPAISNSRSRACPIAASIWSSSGVVRPVWRRPSTEHPRGCAHSASR